MRQQILTTLFAVLALVALPLGAAELPADAPAPIVEAEQPTPAVTEEVPVPAEFDLEAVMDDGRTEMACNPIACNNRCEAQFGEFASGFCENGNCECAV